MPKFFFDLTTNGTYRPEAHGADLNDLTEVRDEAVGLLASILAETIPVEIEFDATCEARDADRRIVLKSHLRLHHEG